MKFGEKNFTTKHSPWHLVPKSTGGRAGFRRVMRSTASLASSWSPHQAEVGPYLASIAFRWRPFDPTGYATYCRGNASDIVYSDGGAPPPKRHTLRKGRRRGTRTFHKAVQLLYVSAIRTYKQEENPSLSSSPYKHTYP